MLKKIITGFALAASLSTMTSCAMTGVYSTNGSGSLFTSFTESVAASGGVDTGGKTGEACAQNILGLASFGDASVNKAAQNGGIKKVATVDRSYLNVLFLYGKSCTIVTGQ